MDIQQKIAQLQLEPHPEGGFYRRIFSSQYGSSDHRAAATSIVYFLSGSDFSHFHRLQSEELWMLGESNTTIVINELGDQGLRRHFLNSDKPVHCVPANTWFAAELLDKSASAFALAYCTVVPGFSFDEFEMANRQALMKIYPSDHACIARLTRVEQGQAIANG